MDRTTVLPEIRKMRFEEEREPPYWLFLTGQSPIGCRPLVVDSPCFPNLPSKLKDPGIRLNQAISPGPLPKREVFPENSGDLVSKRGSWTSFLIP